MLKKYTSNQDKINKINDIRERIANAIIINVEIKRDEDAYEIFESTNAKGLELSISDLLKNLIMKKLKKNDAQKDQSKEKWQEITDNIDETNSELKKFIRYYWISKYSFTSEKKLYKEIKNKITDWKDFLNDIYLSSEIYNIILIGEETDFIKYKNGSKIYNSILALRIMNVSQCFVLFLSILRNYEKLKTDPKRIFEIIEKFTFVYSIISNLPSNKVEKLYSKSAVEIEHACTNIENDEKRKKEIDRIFANIETSLKSELPTNNTVFLDNFQKLEYKNSEKYRKLIKYILSSINYYLSKTKENKIDFNNVNIEHILPQKPDKTWHLAIKDIKKFVNNIGNLTLLDRKLNGSIQNKNINFKILELQKSELPITKDIVELLKTNNMQWNQSEIEQRSKSLSELALNHVWKIK